MRLHADFNGLFGDVLCLSHNDTSLDANGAVVELREGMLITAFEEDLDDQGRRDDLVANGTVERAPEWLRKHNSRWVLKIDRDGVRHESEMRAEVLDELEMTDVTTLYRPVGEKELALIEASGFTTFPPRLPEQPFFYPVLNEAY